MTTQKGFKNDFKRVPAVNREVCQTEIMAALGITSISSFYRKMNGAVSLCPAEVLVAKEIILKYSIAS